jgi:hypothetical protein
MEVMVLTSIEIDFDIHKAIENERRGFDEPPRTALRRLLNLPAEAQTAVPVADAPAGRPWREGLVEIPHGSDARMSYQRGSQIFEGKFLDGKLIVQGREFHTLSSAASALARTKDGMAPSLNGWNYWEVRFPGQEKWVPLHMLRKGRIRAQFTG